jgi:hypothetical protein
VIASFLEGFIDGENADLFAVGSDDPYRGDPDAAIDPVLGFWRRLAKQSFSCANNKTPFSCEARRKFPKLTEGPTCCSMLTQEPFPV